MQRIEFLFAQKFGKSWGNNFEENSKKIPLGSYAIAKAT